MIDLPVQRQYPLPLQTLEQPLDLRRREADLPSQGCLRPGPLKEESLEDTDGRVVGGAETYEGMVRRADTGYEAPGLELGLLVPYSGGGGRCPMPPQTSGTR